MTDFRDKITKELKILLNRDYVHAVWEGGSSATGYLDEYSDLDLMIISDADKIESSFSILEEFFKEKYGILKQFRMPEPTWHGMSQCFYLLDNTPKYFYLDIAIQKLEAEDKFLESDRHGLPVAWFDKGKLLNPKPTSPDKIVRKGKSAFKLNTELFFVVEIEVMKLIRRGRLVDASQEFQVSILRRLSVLLNLKYRPAKVDFGLKYGYRDYPADVNKRLQSIVTYSNIYELENSAKETIKWFYELESELTSEWV